MENELNFYLMIAGLTLASILVVATATLRGWHEWIALKHAQLRSDGVQEAQMPSISSRIDVADLKERVKKLEAIAAGIDV